MFCEKWDVCYIVKIYDSSEFLGFDELMGWGVVGCEHDVFSRKS